MKPSAHRGSRSSQLLLIAAAVFCGNLPLHLGPMAAQTAHQPDPSGRASAGNAPGKQSASQSTSELIRASAYDLQFGSNPYLPSEAQADFTGFLKPEEIPSAAYCGHCHTDLHNQWRQSAHANSFRTPWYLKNVQEMIDSKGVAFSRHCESCHNSTALFTGALTPGSTVARPNDEDGVTCMVCHSVRRIDNTRGIGSYVLGKPAVLVDDGGKPISGLPSDSEVLKHLDWHKRAVMQPFYKSAEYCAACHKAAMPKMLNGYKWLRMFSTYDEWQQSSWSTETPLSFYKKPAASTCQTCHMLREPASDPAAHDGMAASHRWLGANTAVPAQYGFDEQAKRIVDFLRKDQLEVDIFAVTVEHTAASGGNTFVPGTLIAPLGSRSFRLLPGDWVRVDVVVRNKGIGHTLVPELRDFYESWLDFEAKDDAGNTIYRSGAMDENHILDPKARSYTLQMASLEGQNLDRHQVWKTYVKAYDATVAPGRSDVVRYRFRVPAEATGFSVSATVRYRRFRRSFTDWVFGDKPNAPDRFPTVTMAEGRFHFAAGLNDAKGEATLASDMTEALRWNNYGIGMLDRQQFAEAVDAFHHVVQADPRYEAGYVNVAIAEYSRGRYVESLRWLDKAAKMVPQDARAMYYRGLDLRWQTKYDEAVDALKPVADRYPRFRQVHQELGYIYMLQRRFAESKAQYQAVLLIDPDDPVTHRWLGPVLAALGDKAGAARETKLASDYSTDTSAGWLTQRYWREHLDVASKAMPAHTHSADDLHDDADVHKVLNLQNPPSYIWVDHN